MYSMCSMSWACTLPPSSTFLFGWAADSELLLICYQSRCQVTVWAQRFLIGYDEPKLFWSTFDVAITVSPWCLLSSEDNQVGMFSSICHPFFGASPSICFFFNDVFPLLWYFFYIILCHSWHIFRGLPQNQCIWIYWTRPTYNVNTALLSRLPFFGM